MLKKHGVNCGCIVKRLCMIRKKAQASRGVKRCGSVFKFSQLFLKKSPKLEKKSMVKINRLNRIQSNGGSHTEQEWKDLKWVLGDKCSGCGASGVVLQRDHIIPLYHGGSDSIDNIQPLCWKCNRTKNTRLDWVPSVSFMRLNNRLIGVN